MRRAGTGARHSPRGWRGALTAALAAVLALGPALTGCSSLQNPVPRCTDPVRLAIVAQSVPGAAYLPCVRQLSPGWTTSGFVAARDGTSFWLNSDRAPGSPVQVRFARRCGTGGATPSTPRAPGVLTYTRVSSVSPRVSGTLYDVFPGGCVSYRFGFAFGPHIALIEQFARAIGLYPRQELRLVLEKRLGVELDP